MQTGVKIAILFALLAAFGCREKDPKPEPPQITFLDARLSEDQSYSIVRFEFYDADGDLGLKQEENAGEQEFNLFVNYYEKINGVWVLKSPVITYNLSENKYDTTDLHLRIPFIENEAKESLEGETEVDLFYNFNADTFRYELTMRDRALHNSNTITTSEIVIN